MKELSIVIPFFNEAENLKRTIESIRETENSPVEIILVNDHSDDNYPYEDIAEMFETKLIKNELRMGPAASRERGIKIISTPFFLTIDGHMQFYKDNWHGTILKQLKENEQRIYCCQTKVLNEHWEIEAGKPYGAKVNLNGPADKLLEPEWIYTDSAPEASIIEIPCILGATYFTSKPYWRYLRGLEGLKDYGNEEPYISMKAWAEGGGCWLLKTVTIGHVYKQSLTFPTSPENRIYNKLFIAELLLPSISKQDIFKKIEQQTPKEFEKAKKYLIQNSKQIKELKQYYTSILKKDLNNYLLEHNIIQNK